MTLTKERAVEIHEKQKVYPYWGNYKRSMTPDEWSHVQELFRNDPSGQITVAKIVQRIAKGLSQ